MNQLGKSAVLAAAALLVASTPSGAQEQQAPAAGLVDREPSPQTSRLGASRVVLGNGLNLLVVPRADAEQVTAVTWHAVGDGFPWPVSAGVVQLAGELLLEGAGAQPVLPAQEARLAALGHLDQAIARTLGELRAADAAARARLEQDLSYLRQRRREQVAALTALQSPPVQPGRRYVEAGLGRPEVVILPGALGVQASFPREQLPRFLQLETQRMLQPSTRRFYGVRERHLEADDTLDGLAQVEQALFQQVFQGHPLGSWPATPEALELISRQEVEQFYRRWLVPKQTWLVVSGPVSVADVVKLVQVQLGGLAGDRGEPGRSIPVPPQTRLRQQRLLGETTAVGLGCRADLAGLRPFEPVVPLLQAYLADEVSSANLHWLELQPGMLELLVIPSQSADEAATHLLAQLVQLGTRGPEPARLELARARVSQALDDVFADPVMLTRYLASALAATNDERALELLYQRVQGLPPETFRAAMAELLAPEGCSLVLMGPAATSP